MFNGGLRKAWIFGLAATMLLAGCSDQVVTASFKRVASSMTTD